MATFSKRGRLEQVRIWKITVIGDQVHRWSGQRDGKMTHTYDTPGPAGKAGTKAFISGEDRALERALYLTKKKRDSGYREIDPDKLDNLEPLMEAAAITDIDWKSYELPRHFEVGKPLDPKSARDLKRRDDLVASDNRIITLKEDGLCYIVMISDDNVVQIYSRKMEYFTNHFPYIVRAVKEMRFPARTILTCEFVIKRADGRDDRKAVQSLKGKAYRVVEKQVDTSMRPTAIVLNSPYWAGEPVLKTQTVMEWMGTINNFFEEQMESDSFERKILLRYIRPMETLYGDFAWCKQHVLDNEHEGLVIYNKNSVFGEKAFNFRGTTERTSCFKWKPHFECDCLVVFNPDGEFSGTSRETGGKYGTAGKVRGLPKSVALYQLDGTNSDCKLVYLCNCGSGFTIKQREEILKLAANQFGYVGVAEIRYASRSFKSRGDDTNALLEPIFKGFHPDKITTETAEPRLRQ